MKYIKLFVYISFALSLTTCTTLSNATHYAPVKNNVVHLMIPVESETSIPEVMYFPLGKENFDYLYSTCVEYNVPILLVVKLLYKESNFDVNAINYNSNGTIDKGIAQINSDYLEYFEWKYNMEINPFNFENSIDFCIKHLYTLYRSTNDWYLTVCAYNAGLNKVRTGDIPVSTVHYAQYIVDGI